MADVRAFRGIHYNDSLLKDLSAVICPPYDIISPEQQQELYAKNDHNFVRLEDNRELPQDTATDNKYIRAAAVLERWLNETVLETDKEPTIYLHDHYFTYQRKQYRRRALITCVKLEEWDKMIVRPHEGTLTEARGDRLSLLWALQANTSPILAFFEDGEKQIASALKTQEKITPLMSYRDGSGEGHDVRAITDPEVIVKITGSLAGQPLYIADGHHRYESALTYRQERHDAASSASGDDPYNFVMMALVDITDPGLLILPPHRLVRGISKSALNELMDKLRVFFEIEELPLAGGWKQVDTILSQADGVNITLYGLDGESLFILKLLNSDTISHMMPYFHSELYRNLDVSIVDHVILENLLAMSHGNEKTNLNYCYDRQDAINRVISQEYQLALLIRPSTPELIKAVADTGDKMPRKSTYFYPKMPSGLVFNRLV